MDGRKGGILNITPDFKKNYPSSRNHKVSVINKKLRLMHLDLLWVLLNKKSGNSHTFMVKTAQ